MAASALRSGAYLSLACANQLFRSVSSSKISRAEDKAMDRALPKKSTGLAGLSVRNGPVEDMDVDTPVTNGASKRKSRGSISKVNYRDNDSESDGGAPLVGDTPGPKYAVGPSRADDGIAGKKAQAEQQGCLLRLRRRTDQQGARQKVASLLR